MIPTTVSPLLETPLPRSSGAVAVIDGDLFVGGGFNSSQGWLGNILRLRGGG